MDSRYQPAQVRLQPISQYEQHHTLEESWDWKVGNCDSFREYITTRIHQPSTHLYWIILNENDTVGITGFLPHPDHPDFQTTTFLSHAHRGTNLNIILKHSFAEAFKKENRTLIASVDIRNIISIKSLNKIIPTAPLKTEEPKKNRTAYVYNLTDIIPTQSSKHIVSTIRTALQTMP